MREKKKKMTLKGYYRGLPERIAPKNDFLKEVAKRCGVTTTTVRNWCCYGMKPSSYQHIKVLTEITGLKEEDLWEE